MGGYYPPGGGLPPPPGGPQGPGGGRGGSKLPLIIALVVVGVLVLGGVTVGGVAAVRVGSDPTPTPKPKSSTPTPSSSLSSSPTPSQTSSLPALPERLNERADDPKPLTLKELYPATYRAPNGNKYKRYRQKMFDNCGDAAIGTKLKNRLANGNCNQVAVATYVDKKNKTVTSVGLANLKDLAASNKVRRAVNPGKRVFFRPLDGPGPANITSKSFYEGTATTGHFTEWEATTYTNRSPQRGKPNLKLLVARSDLSRMLDDPLAKRMANASP